MVLLDIFNKLNEDKDNFNFRIYVLHYNHKWRKDSNLDFKLIKNYCSKKNIKLIYKESSGKIKKDEETAREQRYSFFTQQAKKYKLKYICTAHHKGDKLETILFRLARGTGPNGLSPIKGFRELSGKVKIFRPLLNVWKKDILKYAIKNKVPYREDKTNLDVIYKRNLVRRKILPLLRKINPEAENNILAFSDLVYSQNTTLNNYFSWLLKKIQIDSPLSLNRKKFLKLDYHTQTAFIYWFFTINGIKGAVSKINIIRDAILNQKKIDLSKKYIMNVTANKIMFDIKK